MTGSTAQLEMSVVVVTPDRFSTIRRTVRFLRGQTVKPRLQLIVVGAAVEALDDARPEELAGFGDTRIVAAGPIEDADKAAYHGIRVAEAPIVGMIEDHAFPEPGWAEAMIEAHRGPWAAVGSAVINANPKSAVSWSNLLMSYGQWTLPTTRGETNHLSRHNLAFKRSVLWDYGPELEHYLGRAGGLLPHLLANGHRFFLEPAARVQHANPSRVSSTVALRFMGGRLWAACRAADHRWPLWKRAIYTIGGPMIPPLRMWRMYKQLFAGGRRRELVPRVFPALLAALTLDAGGQMLGYSLGPGDTARRLANFEFDRLRHLIAEDRQALSE